MRRTAIAACFFLAGLVLIGCEKNVPRSTVHGKIQLHSKPLSGATLILIASDNQTHRVVLPADGSYSIDGVAQGEVSVAVVQDIPRTPVRPERQGSSKGGMSESKDAQAPPPSVTPTISNPLPPQYADVKTSGLKFDLKESKQEWSVDLK